MCSDGKLRPAEVIEKAAANGVQFMSLTDHDTMAGVPEAMEAAERLGVLVFPGVEISAEVKGGENLHILGYFYPGSNSAELEKQLEKIRIGRHKRGKEMLAKLVRAQYVVWSATWCIVLTLLLVFLFAGIHERQAAVGARAGDCWRSRSWSTSRRGSSR